jgi:hypothetical protein
MQPLPVIPLGYSKPTKDPIHPISLRRAALASAVLATSALAIGRLVAVSERISTYRASWGWIDRLAVLAAEAHALLPIEPALKVMTIAFAGGTAMALTRGKRRGGQYSPMLQVACIVTLLLAVSALLATWPSTSRDWSYVIHTR